MSQRGKIKTTIFFRKYLARFLKVDIKLLILVLKILEPKEDILKTGFLGLVLKAYVIICTVILSVYKFK